MSKTVEHRLGVLRFNINVLGAGNSYWDARVVVQDIKPQNVTTAVNDRLSRNAEQILHADHLQGEEEHARTLAVGDAGDSAHHQGSNVDQHRSSGYTLQEPKENEAALRMTLTERTRLIQQLPDLLTVTTVLSANSHGRAQNSAFYPMPHPTTIVPTQVINQLLNGIGATSIISTDTPSSSSISPTLHPLAVEAELERLPQTDLPRVAQTEAPLARSVASTESSLLSRETSAPQAKGSSMLAFSEISIGVLGASAFFDAKHGRQTSALTPTEGRPADKYHAMVHTTAMAATDMRSPPLDLSHHKLTGAIIDTAPGSLEFGPNATSDRGGKREESESVTPRNRATAIPASFVRPIIDHDALHSARAGRVSSGSQVKHGHHDHDPKEHVRSLLKHSGHTPWYHHLRHLHYRLVHGGSLASGTSIIRHLIRQPAADHAKSFSELPHHRAVDPPGHLIAATSGLHGSQENRHVATSVCESGQSSARPLAGYHQAVYQPGIYSLSLLHESFQCGYQDITTHTWIGNLLPHA